MTKFKVLLGKSYFLAFLFMTLTTEYIIWNMAIFEQRLSLSVHTKTLKPDDWYIFCKIFNIING